MFKKLFKKVKEKGAQTSEIFPFVLNKKPRKVEISEGKIEFLLDQGEDIHSLVKKLNEQQNKGEIDTFAVSNEKVVIITQRNNNQKIKLERTNITIV